MDFSVSWNSTSGKEWKIVAVLWTLCVAASIPGVVSSVAAGVRAVGGADRKPSPEKDDMAQDRDRR